MLCNILICIKKSRRQTTKHTIIIIILKIFNFWCMRIKSMHLCIICITNCNMKDLIFEFFLPNTFDIYNLSYNSFSIVMKFFLIQLSARTNHFLNLAVWPSNLNLVIFSFESDCFPLVIHIYFDFLSFYSVFFFSLGEL